MSIQAVINAARKEIGYKEGKANDNKFAKIAGHANNQPWCATFIRACFIQGGEEKAIPNTAYCPYLESWAREHNRIVPLSEAKRGDLALLDFSRSGKAEHVAMLTHNYNPNKPNLVRAISGNTSDKSPANGDTVAVKYYANTTIRCIIRPKWSK